MSSDISWEQSGQVVLVPFVVLPFRLRWGIALLLKSFKFNKWELGGALGDLGTLLPLMVALITLNHMNPTSMFLVVGLTYALCGLFYRLPIPVQPLKVVAAIAKLRGYLPASSPSPA